jgi:hypothetical protein
MSAMAVEDARVLAFDALLQDVKGRELFRRACSHRPGRPGAIKPVDMQFTANMMRKYPGAFDVDGPIDPSIVDTTTGADFICKRPWMFQDFATGEKLGR